MTRRWRTVRYGASVALVLVGVVCAVLISGTTGGTLASAFVGLGLLGVVSTIFYEVGLSEDRDRAREQRAAREPPSPTPEPKRRLAPRPRRPDRMRGQRRRLR